MAGVLDLDIAAITDPNDPAPEDRYRLVITKAEKKESDSGSAGAILGYRIQTPGEQQGKSFQNYINCVKKDGTENKFGTWYVKELYTLKGVKKGKFWDNLSSLIGLEFDADVTIEAPQEGSDFGPQNSVKRIVK